MTDSSASLVSRRFFAKGMRPLVRGDLDVHDRHSLIGGFDQAAVRQTTIMQIGCGMGSLFALGYARKGFSKVVLLDPDHVDITNLNRQFFYNADRGQNKAHCLGRNLVPHCTQATEIVTYGLRWEDAIALNLSMEADIVVCAVDSPETRWRVALHYRKRGVPVIFAAVGLNADKGYIFVQEASSDSPCFLCAFPEEQQFRGQLPCAIGSAIDVLLSVSGFVLYAMDSLIMVDRPRAWNRMWVSLTGTAKSGGEKVSPSLNCPACGGQSALTT